ncbi:hypothetical protein [Cronobacter phage JC01]|uniref:3'-5' exoribonuclease Rv2179c-like domain-containing protein n=1 Tax=Cronobacter phage JC01 TaxID=2729575 RepID=A0A6M3YKI9_9CAUD|nr:exonuclease [Cronobacter phage JC01]QJI52284.1 hypothetical protein [Cronobacter phage JC01]
MKKKHRDVMIDIETLGRSPGCSVLSIGAVAFDRYTGEIGETFYCCMGYENARAFGHVDPDTLEWWQKQSDAAKQDAFNGSDNPRESALKFIQWLDGNDLVWGNGSVFDITILEAWFAQLHLPTPWKFWNIRDVRTAVDLAGINPLKFEREGTFHNALDDAIHQVKYMSAGIQWLRDKI